ncbi:MAG TPA: hypothetical protein VIK38_05335, partial [Coriobacteriia bacterium]
TDVVPVQVGVAQVEKPIAQRESRVDQRRPRQRTDLAILVKTALRLEGEHGRARGSEEDAVHTCWAEIRPEGDQPALDVLDRCATVTCVDRSHTRPPDRRSTRDASALMERQRCP